MTKPDNTAPRFGATPTEFRDCGKFGAFAAVGFMPHLLVYPCTGVETAEFREHAARIVACVNACEGFDSPADSIAALRVAGGNGLDALLQADRLRAALNSMWEFASSMVESRGCEGDESMTDGEHAAWQDAAALASAALAEQRSLPLDDDTGAGVVMPHFLVLGDKAFWQEPFGLAGPCLMSAPAVAGVVHWDDSTEEDKWNSPAEYAAIVSCLEATS